MDISYDIIYMDLDFRGIGIMISFLALGLLGVAVTVVVALK